MKPAGGGNLAISSSLSGDRTGVCWALESAGRRRTQAAVSANHTACRAGAKLTWVAFTLGCFGRKHPSVDATLVGGTLGWSL